MDKAVAGYDDFQSKYKDDPLGENLPVALAAGYLLPKNNQLDKAIQYFRRGGAPLPAEPLVKQALSQEATALGGLKRYDDAIRTLPEIPEDQSAPGPGGGGGDGHRQSLPAYRAECPMPSSNTARWRIPTPARPRRNRAPISRPG